MAIINGEPGASKISVRVKLTANFRRQNERSSSYVRCITKPCSTPTLHSDVRCSFLKIFPFPKGNLFPGMATPLSRSGSAGHRVNRKYCISQRTDGRTDGRRAGDGSAQWAPRCYPPGSGSTRPNLPEISRDEPSAEICCQFDGGNWLSTSARIRRAWVASDR
jgi:hypothetical protein